MLCWVLGHSFISRLKEHFLVTDTMPQFPQGDIHVQLTGIPGAHISGPRGRVLHSSLSPDILQGVDVVYLAMGTNDLASGATPATVAQHIVSVANFIVTTSQVKMVIIDQIIPRSNNMSKLSASKANQAIQDLLHTGQYPQVKFWTHQAGFWNNTHKYLTRDGVHLTKQGMTRYWRSIRGAILWANSTLNK
jgi:lysophospholipase L1-like esterase